MASAGKDLLSANQLPSGGMANRAKAGLVAFPVVSADRPRAPGKTEVRPLYILLALHCHRNNLLPTHAGASVQSFE